MRLTPLFALALIAVAANASQPLETESARLLPAGVAKIEESRRRAATTPHAAIPLSPSLRS
jgi:hypothetical protein